MSEGMGASGSVMANPRLSVLALQNHRPPAVEALPAVQPIVR
jgi:hypothetical protein